MDLKIKGFPITLPVNVKNLFYERHGSFLAREDIDDFNVLLLSIYIIEENVKSVRVSREICKQLFEEFGRNSDNFRKLLHNDRKKNPRYIREYSGDLTLTATGIRRVNEFLEKTGREHPRVIISGKNFTAIKQFHEFFGQYSEGEDIYLCDSYISHITLYPFADMPKMRSLKILTRKIMDETQFKVYIQKLTCELKIPIEVRVNGKIHDRYLLIGERCWSIGASIKDLGNKDTAIQNAEGLKDSLKYLFSQRWEEGNIFQ